MMRLRICQFLNYRRNQEGLKRLEYECREAQKQLQPTIQKMKEAESKETSLRRQSHELAKKFTMNNSLIDKLTAQLQVNHFN
jgi:signal transduction histidine kinase